MPVGHWAERERVVRHRLGHQTADAESTLTPGTLSTLFTPSTHSNKTPEISTDRVSGLYRSWHNDIVAVSLLSFL